ncbi:MAG: DUF1553 domain-containing protein [Saprospiraceae bacterium]|nr:DUF1553 domain-containing protein [Saprospiraceae bacterium]
MRFFDFLLLIFLLPACHTSLPEEVELAMANLPDEISYNFHIKPILSDRCYACHGPDEEARKGDLRLDLEEYAKKLRDSGNKAIVPHRSARSALAARIVSTDKEYQMPPPESKLNLLPHEKAMLIKWIDQGAKYEKHWSFISPKKPVVPAIPEKYTAINPVDNFLIAEMLNQGLTPSAQEGAERLLRRVYLDLTGLPPSISEVDAFIADQSPGAFENVVDRLLQSVSCAERLTMEWMDVARYADSHGLHADGWRNMWPWRDWVIEAFHSNMSYNQFVTEQLAGDLLPGADRDQIIATAFHRNHPMTAEGGVIDEEFRLEYVSDRTNTTATAFMGLTMECAKCHDHKFDPISQKNYYEFSAFFNNQRELGMTGDDGNFGPMLTLASSETEEKLTVMEKEIKDVDRQIRERKAELQKVEAYLQSLPPIDIDKNLAFYLPLEKVRTRQLEGSSQKVIDGNQKCTSNGDPKLVPGKVGQALEFDHEYDELYLADLGVMDVEKPLSIGIWIHTRKKMEGKTQVLIGNAGEKNTGWRGWDFYLDQDNRLNLRLIRSLPHNLLHVRAQDSVPLQQWVHVGFTYDGTGRASGSKMFVDGWQVQTMVEYDRLDKNIRTVRPGAHEEFERPLRVAKSYRAFTGDNGVFEGKIDELRIYHREASPLEMTAMAGQDPKALAAADRWTHIFLQDPSIRVLQRSRRQILSEIISISDSVPEIMVMEEMMQPRATFILDRGQYDAPLEEVQAKTPDEVLPYPSHLPSNRLGLATWLFDPQHPLTSRATVNRYWQMIFGRGIVKSANDLGNQGALPSHPDLLDWLAIEFRDNGWDVKALLKILVMSATYQQSSYTTPEQRGLDPENIYLSRSSSYRWPAEIIRDNALSASGLLVRKVGGPSVKPYQPDGLWIEKGSFSHVLLRYEPSSGEDLYRRSLYTFIKRTSPHPAMTVFDAPNRDVCTLTRETTNTPLQALVLLNDPQFVEAARVLAQRVQKHAHSDFDARAAYAFRLATGRHSTVEEIQVLKETFDEQLQSFQQNRKAASNLLAVGEHAMDSNLSVVETAAWTMVAGILLNHDEAYMKR